MRNIVCHMTIIFICLTGSIAFAAPDMQVEQPNFDFGEVYQGQKVRHTFAFVNQGDETLLIDRVRSSCGCTAVLVSEKTIPPGSKGEIQANFDSARFRGAVSKTIYVYSNDPVRPVMQLDIKGKVLEIVAVEPAQINFGKVKAGEPVTQKVQLHNQGDRPLTIGKPHATAAELVVKMPKTSFAKGETVAFDVELTPTPGQTRFSGYVLVPVDGVPGNELRIPVYATLNNQ